METLLDIPDVEREIPGVSRLVLSHWRRAQAEAFAEFEIELRERERRERLTAAAIVALLLLFLRRRAKSPLPQPARDRVRRSSRRLLSLGGVLEAPAFAGIPRQFLPGPSFGSITGHEGMGVFELEAMTAFRLGPGTERRLMRIAQRYVDDRNRRGTTGNPQSIRVPTEFVPDLRATASDAPTDESPTDEAIAALRAATRDNGGAVSTVITDAWAYRQANIGAVLAAQEAGIKTLVAFNNPPPGPDERTTPFCRWVHEKIIRVDRAVRQVARFEAAALAGQDPAEAWPFIPQSAKALREARAELSADRRGAPAHNDEVFRRHFVNAGMPPYHYRCRTVARPS